MAKNKGLHLSKTMVEDIMEEFGNIVNQEQKNPSNNRIRYYIEKEGKAFYIDIFFRKDCTLTVFPMPSGDNKELSEELVHIIKSNDNYQGVTSGTFTCSCDFKRFLALKNYLSQLEGVTKIKDEDKGPNGHVIQFISEIGDKITLTFYQSTGKILYQGHLMNLYLEVKSFMSPLAGNIETEIIDARGIVKKDKNKEIDKYINTYVPTAYNGFNDTIQGFIRDTFRMIITNDEFSEYSSWTFPILKVLEYRIKQMLGFKEIYLDDKKGFQYRNLEYRKNMNPKHKWKYIFLKKDIHYTLDRKLSGKFSQDEADCLLECYNFFNRNRHTLFHTKQEILGTRVLKTKEEAKMIIFDTCNLLENSCIKWGK